MRFAPLHLGNKVASSTALHLGNKVPGQQIIWATKYLGNKVVEIAQLHWAQLFQQLHARQSLRPCILARHLTT
jgi:hypothetical protein